MQSQIIGQQETTESVCYRATRGLELSTAPAQPVSIRARGTYGREANEAPTIINGHACIGLIDTSSQITSIAESFYKKHLAECTIHSLGNLGRVVGAGDRMSLVLVIQLLKLSSQLKMLA